MKNSNLIKIFLVMVVSIALFFTATSVFADDAVIDLTNTIGNTTTDNNTSADNNTALDTNALDDGLNTNTNTNSSYNSLTTTTNTNSSSYNTNNTNLPSTGLEGSGLTIAIIAVLAISGVYAYKKVRDYKNI